MPSSCSSTSPHQMLQNLITAMGKSDEKETRYTNLTLGSLQDVTSERRDVIPSFRYGPVLIGSEVMALYPPKPNKVFKCQFCKKGFSSPHALGGHQNAHKQEREFDKKRKQMEADFPGLLFFNHYLDKPHILLGGYSRDALSNENHLGFTLQPFKSQVYQSFSTGDTGGLADFNMSAVRRLTPTRFFTGNTTTIGSASNGSDPFLSNNNMYPLIPRNFFPSPPPSTNDSASNGFGPFPSNDNMYPLIPRNFFPVPPPSTNDSASNGFGHLPSNDNMYPLIPRNLFPFSPPRTSRENVLSEDDLTLKLGMNSVVEIDDDDDEDQPEEGTYHSGGIDLSLSL